MRYFDAFSGYGGFSLGIQKAYGHLHRLSGGEEQGKDGDSSLHGRDSKILESTNRGNEAVCIGYSEIDKYAIQIYQKHFPYEQCEYHKSLEVGESQSSGIQPTRNQPNDNISQRPENYQESLRTSGSKNPCQCNHKNYGDITKLDPSTLPDFDLFVGGFPCQAFSIAGKRGGFEDTRGTLIYDVLRIVKEKHPRIVLLENVKGLLSHDGGRTFKTIITSLAELGYAVEWQVLNSKDFGVPQNRERVFIIGHFGGFGGRAIFPITRSNGENIRTSENDEHQSNRSSISSGRYLPNTQHITGREAYAIRRLTPTECERLMGLPDGWTEGVSDTQRYKLCGNGVVVNVVEEIIKRLL
jgi:DNA (cytosine-5)-methyltransferase 1